LGLQSKSSSLGIFMNYWSLSNSLTCLIFPVE
jgi:hypothetical protein